MRVFVAGDVMPGRGIDQILPAPCDPRIFESCMKSAEGYLRLAERRNGPIPVPVDRGYVWGPLPGDLDARACDLRIVNLETAITDDGHPAPKAINYRMSRANAAMLKAARLDACTLANNHVLDWGGAGLRDTLDTLDGLGIAHAGAGRTAQAAFAPCALGLTDGGRLRLLAFGDATAGVPGDWAAGTDSAGVATLPEDPRRAVEVIRDCLPGARVPGDLVAVSLHWGGNWGFAIPDRQRHIARALVDSGAADLVFGHSAHHPKGLELRGGKLILYGCGDLVNDYEGIGGQGGYRPDLGAAYVCDLDRRTGELTGLEILPYRRHRFALTRAGDDDTGWLADMLARDSLTGGATFRASPKGTLRLVPPG
ncbi:CapA family protein [Roseovarius salinarum]|uniref:CapA family protein n=1 Tax=Roseovarius salinarum TaxID=1981892 RepID=UPI000C3251A9|nr:CapA family protein [Roseovarius salinarum]